MTAPLSDADLAEIIGREIDGAGGAIPFARFMELALYDPDHGYYLQPRPAAGRHGADFLTAPELHPIFGQVVARQIAEMRSRLGEPPDFTIREYAAGSGALAEAILGEMGADVRYEAIELNRHRRAELAARLPLARVTAGASDTPITGVVLANELLDALPVHRVAMRGGRLREVYVRRGETARSFTDQEGEPSTPALAARLAAEGVDLADGQRGEVNLGIDAWLAEAAAGLHRGYMLIADYGYRAADLYSERRGAGTLLSYSGHRVVDDPYADVGRQDLTAHVDFTAVERAARRAGLMLLGLTSQAEFLVGAGAETVVERVRTDPATDLAGWVALRSALGRLLDPRAMGAFKVCVLGRGIPIEPPLQGLAYRIAGPPAAAPGGDAQ